MSEYTRFVPDDSGAILVGEIPLSLGRLGAQHIEGVLNRGQEYDHNVLTSRYMRMCRDSVFGHDYLQARVEDDFNPPILAGVIHTAPHFRGLAPVGLGGLTVEEAGLHPSLVRGRGNVAAALLFVALDERVGKGRVHGRPGTIGETRDFLQEAIGISSGKFSVRVLRESLLQVRPWLNQQTSVPR